MINAPEPFATKRRVGCVMWLAIAALIVSSVSILIDVTQEMAWNSRVEQAQAIIAAPIVPVTEPTIIPQIPTATPAPSLDATVTQLPTTTQTPTPVPPSPTPLPTWTSVPANVVPRNALDSLFVHGNGSPQFPAGEQGKITVVAVGRMETSEFGASTTLPIVVRNNMGTYISRIGISATARDANGSILAAGGGDLMTPNLVQPGEIAFGYAYFSDVNLPDDTRFEFQADFTPAGDSLEEFENIRDLEVTEVSRVEDRLVGFVRNQYNEVLTGPISVEAVCFDAGGQLLQHHSTFTDQDTLSAGVTASFQIALDENQDCTTFLATGSGYSE